MRSKQLQVSARNLNEIPVVGFEEKLFLGIAVKRRAFMK